jgi:predicted Zn finger-like uncharacterized protein
VAIRFACPQCEAIYTVDDGKAGKKATCKKCGQRLQVPDAEPIDLPPAAKPGKVTAIAWMFMGGGAWAIANVVTCALLYRMCCLWPGLWFASVWSILAIIRGAELLGTGWRSKYPRQLAIMQIVQIVNFDVVNLVMGIIGLVFLNDPRVRSSFGASEYRRHPTPLIAVGIVLGLFAAIAALVIVAALKFGQFYRNA